MVGGGHDRFKATKEGIVAEAMLCLYQSPLGSGVAAYHRRRSPGFVDTLYGGFYRKEVFERVGGFNEGLSRNQDNELNARVTAGKMRIFFDPSLSTSYVLKCDFGTFLRRGFSFGFHHPETWFTNIRSFRLRHVVPALFILYLLGLTALPFSVGSSVLFLVPLMIYLALLMASGVCFMFKKSPIVGLLTVPLFMLYHISYGLGTLVGFPVHLVGQIRSGISQTTH